MNQPVKNICMNEDISTISKNPFASFTYAGTSILSKLIVLYLVLGVAGHGGMPALS